MSRELYKAAVDDIKVNEDLLKKLAIEMKMKEKPRSRGIMRNYGVIAVSAAILIIAAVVMQYRIWWAPSTKVAKLSVGNTVTLSHGKGKVYINKIEGVTSAKLRIPEGAYSKEYNMQQLATFFGRNPLPVIPKEFKAEMNSTIITFDAQGKMLFMSALGYSKDINDPDAPSIDIKLNKDALPPKDCLYNSNTLKESTIGSTKVVIGAMSMGSKFDDEGKPTSFYDVYSAEFIYNKIGYSITAKRIDAETFLNLLESVIK